MAGPGGLAVLPFRAGTPYEGEDLVYFADNPEQFFARCTRQVGAVRGTCLHERAVDAAEVTLRFPSAWLDDWRGVSAGADRLIAQLHPQSELTVSRTATDRDSAREQLLRPDPYPRSAFRECRSAAASRRRRTRRR